MFSELPLMILNTSSGNGNLAVEPCSPSTPYKAASNLAKASALTLVESITSEAVGLKPVTSTGVVDNSQEK